MNSRRYLLFIIIATIVLLALLSGCAPGDGKNTADARAGFFWGIWHGWIAPVTLIISLFNKTISIYEVHNTGFLYNLGYYLAIVGGFGGLAIFRKRKN